MKKTHLLWSAGVVACGNKTVAATTNAQYLSEFLNLQESQQCEKCCKSKRFHFAMESPETIASRLLETHGNGNYFSASVVLSRRARDNAVSSYGVGAYDATWVFADDSTLTKNTAGWHTGML